MEASEVMEKAEEGLKKEETETAAGAEGVRRCEAPRLTAKASLCWGAGR